MNAQRTSPALFASRARAAGQRGAATLVVVMLLFFVVTLTAAYASRNLIFEQRTSANQLRSTQSVEAAEAGMEWALTMLSSGRIDDDCVQTADVARDNFRDRYLTVDASTGIITRKSIPPPSVANLWAACSLVGEAWVCRCPSAVAGAELSAGQLPTGTAAFAVRFVPQTTRPGVVRIEVNGCNSYDVACLTASLFGGVGKCQTSTLCAMLAMHSGLKRVPSAALTVRGALNGTALTVINQDVASGGLAVHHGGANNFAGGLQAFSLPGTPSSAAILSDGLLAGTPADANGCATCVFTATFGLRPEVYKRLTAVTPLDCSAGCNTAMVNAALASNRSPIVWLSGAGGLTVGGAGDTIGSAAAPVVLVVDGPVTMNAAAVGATIFGAVYAGGVLTLDGGQVRGAAITASSLSADGASQVVYDSTILTRLRYTTGPFVRMAGSWRDF